MKILQAVAPLAVMLVVGCGSTHGSNGEGSSSKVDMKPAATGQTKLWLASTSTGDTVSVSVKYEQGSSPAPRVADLRISHSEALELIEATAGSSASRAGKELTVQQPTPEVVRLVLLSKSAGEIGSGELAVLAFRRKSTAPAKLDLLMDKPVFAPIESVRGLAIGDPLQL